MQKHIQFLELCLFVLMITTSLSGHAQKELPRTASTSKIKAVVAPLNAGDTGPQVKNLTAVLLLLVERSVIKSFNPPYRPVADELVNLCSSARHEMNTSDFGPATRGLSSYFQAQNGLGDGLSGNVDIDTAFKLNEFLKALGVIASTRGRE